MNQTLMTILNRKSVRKFSDQPVSKEQLETILRAGMAAPSAVNIQPWAFIAVTSREILDELNDRLPYAKMLRQSSAAIVVCGDLSKTNDAGYKDYWVQDCSAATQNILLAAEALGLGAVWTAVYHEQDRIDTVRDILNLPDHIIPLNVIPIGRPADDSPVKDKWKPENIHWDVW